MATPAPTSAKDADTLRKAIVAPTGVALIGASADITKTTARPLRYLRRPRLSGSDRPDQSRARSDRRPEGLAEPHGGPPMACPMPS